MNEPNCAVKETLSHFLQQDQSMEIISIPSCLAELHTRNATVQDNSKFLQLLIGITLADSFSSFCFLNWDQSKQLEHHLRLYLMH